MKTILLTSAGMDVKEEILEILPKPANQIKLAHISTASKAEGNLSYLEKENREMKALGFQVEEIDIEGKNEAELRKLLEDRDVIYVQGGNTFYLLKYVRESGFDKVVKDLIDKGVIYIGVSAGSYIACPTIEMANWKSQDRNVVGLTDFAGLNLVPFLLSVHYKPEYKEVLKREILAAKYPVKILTDEQAILIRDGEISLVGKGEEIKI
ncbi:Type 1 glutamine amidotransferase-like domain-containing protein [Candidatus Wolfebacteria bacterium]|nr:Type 1 glutamine amidotransferase-like domain-containing protein [Candidatus Wolfebacteria bacterium]